MTTAAAARILVIEDDDCVRRLVADALGDYGYAVEVAPAGEEALDRVRLDRGFDLVVADVVLPGISGSALDGRLRAILPAIPILHITGYADDVIARHGIPPDSPGLLRKPFTLESLAGVVRAALAR